MIKLTYADINNKVMAQAFEKIRGTSFSVRRTRQIVSLGRRLQDELQQSIAVLNQMKESHGETVPGIRQVRAGDDKIVIPAKEWRDYLQQDFDVDFEPFTEAELDPIGLSVDELEALLPLTTPG